MKRLVVAVAIAMMVAGCAGTPDSAKADRAHGKGYRCDVIKVTGSHLPTKRCTTTAQREKERKSAEEMLHRQQTYIQKADNG